MTLKDGSFYRNENIQRNQYSPIPETNDSYEAFWWWLKRTSYHFSQPKTLSNVNNSGDFFNQNYPKWTEWKIKLSNQNEAESGFCLKLPTSIEKKRLLVPLSLFMCKHHWSNNSDCNLMTAFNNQEEIIHCLIISLSKCLPKHPRLHIQGAIRQNKICCVYLPFPWGVNHTSTSIPWTPVLSHQHLDIPSTDT